MKLFFHLKPINETPKNDKNVPTLAIFGHVFYHFRYHTSFLVTNLTEEILSFDLSGFTSKSVKNWLQK